MGAITFKKLSGSGGTTGVEITYAELKALRDSGKLVTGTEYIITDYECTTTTPNTRSGGHNFDIIVVADSESTLNENARARKHAGDTYFEHSNLSAWELKYSLDNDKSRFDWADETNGKGVIYYMKDEWENEVPYDFKNIMWEEKAGFVYSQFGNEYTFARETSLDTVIGGTQYYGYRTTNAVTAVNSTDFLATDNPVTHSSTLYKTDGSVISYGGSILSINYIDKDYYTFNTSIGDVAGNKEATSQNYDINISDMTVNNKIKPYSSGIPSSSTGRIYILNKNIFNSACQNNTFEEDCSENLLDRSCKNNTFGFGCKKNELRSNCSTNTFMGTNVRCFIDTSGEKNTFFKGASDVNLLGYCYQNKIGGDIIEANGIKNFNIINTYEVKVVDSYLTNKSNVTIERTSSGKIVAHWVKDDLTLGGKYTEDNGTTWVDIESSSGSGGSGGGSKLYRHKIGLNYSRADGYAETVYFNLLTTDSAKYTSIDLKTKLSNIFGYGTTVYSEIMYKDSKIYLLSVDLRDYEMYITSTVLTVDENAGITSNTKITEFTGSQQFRSDTVTPL